MGRFHDIRFPNESDHYRAARDELLQAEIDLRRRIEEVAQMRRKLPLGGTLKEDYVFEEGARNPADEKTITKTRLSELFEEGKKSLFIYSFMFDPDKELPCAMCTSILDGLDGQHSHVTQRINFAVVAKAPIDRIRAWARGRGWTDLRLLSSNKNTYNADYHAENDEWGQIPAINVFTMENGVVRHFYAAELLYAPVDDGQNGRQADLIWPLWNVFDMTPEGRGSDWYPSVKYD